MSLDYVFAPHPFLKHNMVWGREKGDGVGVYSWALDRVAYIPNLSLLQSLELFEKLSKI